MVTVLRFLSFVALLYLSLHVIFCRLINKPDSKVLWFFSVLTTPLTRPVERWIVPGAANARLRFASLIVYGLVWLAFVLLDNALKNRP